MHLTEKLAMSVDKLELTMRTRNCFMDEDPNYRISTVADLVRREERELLRIPNFGRKCLNEVKAQLVLLGLHLGMTDAIVDEEGKLVIAVPRSRLTKVFDFLDEQNLTYTYTNVWEEEDMKA